MACEFFSYYDSPREHWGEDPATQKENRGMAPGFPWLSQASNNDLTSHNTIEQGTKLTKAKWSQSFDTRQKGQIVDGELAQG